MPYYVLMKSLKKRSIETTGDIPAVSEKTTPEILQMILERATPELSKAMIYRHGDENGDREIEIRRSPADNTYNLIKCLHELSMRRLYRQGARGAAGEENGMCGLLSLKGEMGNTVNKT